MAEEDREAQRLPRVRGGSVRIRAPGEQSMGRRSSPPPSRSPSSSQGDMGDHDAEQPSPTGEGSVGFASRDGVDEDGMSTGSCEEELPFPGLNDKVFYCLSQTSKPRVWCIQLVCWPWFERISMAVIILNCITLGMYEPCEKECTSTRCVVLEGFDHFIFAFFAAEMVVKILALGVRGKSGYFFETWNRLDCFIVVAGITDYTMQALEYSLQLENMNLTAIRTIRVLRPLRAINRIPSLRILVMLLLDTLPMLGNVLMLCFFVFFIFGIIGVQLWKGLLRNRCFLDLPDNTSIGAGYDVTTFYTLPDMYQDYVCSFKTDAGDLHCDSDHKDPFLIGEQECNSTALPYINNSYDSNLTDCVNWNQYYTMCKTSDVNPFLGSISFDNILYAWVAIFQVITLESWVEIQYYLQDVHSQWVWIYFMLLIVIGAFFLINLCLVVIATQFSETKQRESKLMAEQRKRFRSTSTLASNSEPGSCYDEILKYIGHLVRKVKRKVRRWHKGIRGKRQRKVMPAISLRRKKRRTKSVHVHCHHHHHHHHYHFGSNSPQAPRASPENSDIGSSPTRQNRLVVPSANGSLGPSVDSLHSITYCTENLSRLEPLPSRSRCKSSPHHHVVTTLSIHRASSINYPTTNSKDARPSSALAKLTAETALNSMMDVPPNKLQERWKDVCLGETLNKYSKLPPVKNGNKISGDGLAPAGAHPPLAQRLSAPPLTHPPSSYPGGHPHLAPPSPCLSIHSAGCPVHQPCPVHTPCRPSTPCPSHSSCPTHSPCPSRGSHTCPHACPEGHNDYDWTESDLESDEDSDADDSDYEEEQKGNLKFGGSGCKSFYRKVSDKIGEIVESKYFMRSILICILVNTLSMGIEFHNQPDELTEALEISNRIFTSLFALEMLLKLMAYGFVGYIRNGFNVFDGIIVIVSVVEIVQQGGGGLSVLRTFRLLRILKLVRFMPALRRQLLIMLKTMDNVATFFSLLSLFIFIFSILGMHLFGCNFCRYVDGVKVCDRKNFDNLLWALVTVFQILTQEDWNIVLYNGMHNNSAWAALYFIALMTFGNYVLFNLLVAILVEGFAAEPYEQKESSLAAASRESLEEDEGYSGEEHEKKEEGNDVQSVTSGKDTSDEKQLALPPPESTQSPPPASLMSPPIITRTAATPQGSPMCEQPKGFKGPFLDNQSIDSDTQSLSSFHIPGSPRLPRSNLSRNGSGRNRNVLSANLPHVRDRNYLRPFQPPEADHGADSDSHSNISSRISSRRSSSDHNGYVPDSDSRRTSVASCNGDSRRTSYISCNGGSFTAQLEKHSLEAEKRSSRGSVGRRSSRHEDEESIEDPDQVDEAKKQSAELGRKCFCLPGDCNCTKCCPEPKGCFKTRIEYSLYLLSPHNRFRRRLQSLIAHRWFDYVILLIIMINCITLAMERPDIRDDSVERTFLSISNYIFTGIFTFEMVVKVLAKGLFIGEHAYLYSGWNIMDGSLVVISWIDITISLVSSNSPEIFGILRVFRLLRTLRPLRVISRAPGLKLVVQTLLSSLRPIGNIVIICCTFFVIFGILGIQLFKGTFYYCTGPSVKNVMNKTHCLQAHPNNQWVNQQYNFDNLGQALMALFVLASKDGWVEIMYNGIDAVGVDKQPKENNNEWLILFFISFILIVGFFVLNMFVGVVVENFHKCREQQAAEETARRQAKRLRKMEKARQSMSRVREGDEIISNPKKRQARARERPYYIDYSRSRRFIHNCVINKYFDLGVAAVIFINVISMALEHYGMSKTLQDILRYLNYFFTVVFILEAVLKIAALGFKRYIKDRWNQLDMIIIILSIVGIFLEELQTDIIPINPTIIRIMRVLRIARVLKIMKTMKGLRELLAVLMGAIPQVGNLGLLFFLLFFIFAALGVELFGRLDCTKENPCQGLGRHASFKNFFIAFLTLFRIATADNWNGIMKDTLRQEKCNKSSDCTYNCCASSILAPIYFVCFVLMAQFVLVNVVVAVLMKHLEESHKMEQDEEDDQLALEEEMREEGREAARREEEAVEQQQQGQEAAEQANSSDDNDPETPLTPLLKPLQSSDIVIAMPSSQDSVRVERETNLDMGKSLVPPTSLQLSPYKVPVDRVQSVPGSFHSQKDSAVEVPEDGGEPSQQTASTERKQQLPCQVPHIQLPSDNEHSSSTSSSSHHLAGDRPRISSVSLESEIGSGQQSPASRSSFFTASPRSDSQAKLDSDPDRTGPSSKDAARHLSLPTGPAHPDRDMSSDLAFRTGEAESNAKPEEVPLQQWPRKSSDSSTGDAAKQPPSKSFVDDVVRQKSRDLDPRAHPRVRRGARPAGPSNLNNLASSNKPHQAHRRASKSSVATSSSDSDSSSPPNRKRTRRRQRHSPSKTLPQKREDGPSLPSSREPSVSGEIPEIQVKQPKEILQDCELQNDGTDSGSHPGKTDQDCTPNKPEKTKGNYSCDPAEKV
ncbi:voltage-dependent T-type calcium channel subunit alpha-1I-like isoform X3 [Acanthaster planci]|uniref:Voltage-dependent T-type calcium channel subunit alpha n=1 Tax=Acanthaster planci TaxID=133434 RepID=A0A8B7YDU3_ACAPL|nr:voltage-dependent T-type calcium channel subunit alpha-1I-like isoform X3 [Acanthaster planci]